MPRYDINRADFIRRIERRQRWAFRGHRVRRLHGAPKPLQAVVYDATFENDDEAVSYHYAKANDHMPDFEAPEWVNEKVRWQFLNHRNPLMSLAADKIAVRDYLRLKGAVVAPPALIASGSDPRALKTVELPERFVLKSAFGSGQNHRQTPESLLTRHELAAEAAAWMEWDQWRHTGELHYRDVPKRWLVEELVPATRQQLEFKFFCIHGEPVFVAVITERSAAGYRRATFDLDWNRLEITTPGVTSDPRPVPRPPELELMIAEARRLSEDFLHVRVDFLMFDRRLLFSELTFANLAAAVPFAPRWINRELGAMMDLSRAPGYLEHGRQIAGQLQWRSTPEAALVALDRHDSAGYTTSMADLTDDPAPEGSVIPEPLARALDERYLTYALSTIVHRAQPDARDRLKPLHRRILCAMRGLRLDPGAAFRNCAQIVGEVMGSQSRALSGSARSSRRTARPTRSG